jgi:hypothetical protein
MRSLFAVVLAVALLSLAVGAMAAGTATAPAKAKANMIGGTIKSVGAHSLTIDRGPTHSAADRIVVVSLNKSTAYTLGGKPGKLNDAKAGSKVFIRLTDKLQGTKATAAAVHVQVAQPAKPKMSTSSMPAKSK